ncbi:MAG: GDSL-type esterase/lipase family protein [Chthoniobacteraceae bacterium]
MSIFEDEFRAFALAEAREPLPRDPVLFYGSSSIRLWASLAADFPGLPVVNRAFGGSTLRECVAEMERLVFPVEPRAIVLYAGENDLDQGASPEEVRGNFAEFVTRIDDRLGLLPIVFISIKPSPARQWHLAKFRQTNALVRAALSAWPNARYLDLHALMLHPDGDSARGELYAEDGLHLNDRGYQLWAAEVRTCLSELKLLP